MSDAEVGSIIGYLALDRSDWDSELTAAKAKADELGRDNPNIKIDTNAPSAIAQLAAVAAATKRLQDAQGAEGVAQAKLTDLESKGSASASQMAAAQERLQKAHRSTASAVLQLAAAYDETDRASVKAEADADKVATSTKKIGDSSNEAKPFVVNLWGALAAIAPAAAPIAGVATGALAGLIPVAATVALGIKGITADMQDGKLQASQYSGDVKSLSGEYATLQQIAAGGIMAGVDKGLAQSHGLFSVVNQDVTVMSNQIGEIIAGGGPALLHILTALNPLFITFGNAVSNGAQHLEQWATSSDGVSRFVAYVQAELPDVLQLGDNLVAILAHLVEGAAPFGGVLLHDIDDFTGALAKIPVGVLQTAIPLVVALYAAVKTYQGLTVLVNLFTAAQKAAATASAASASAQQAASLKRQAALAEEASAAADAASVEATAEAEKAQALADASAALVETTDENISLFASEARAATDSAAIIAQAYDGTASLFASSSEEIAVAAGATADALQAEADRAATYAAEIAAASETAATEATAAGLASKEAAVGFGAVAGPVGAAVVGVGLLATMFMHSGQAAQQAAQLASSYLDVLKQTKGAINDVVDAQVIQNLTTSGAYTAAQKYGISQTLVTQAAMGSVSAQKQLAAATQGNFDAIGKVLGPAVDQANAIKTASTQYGQLSAQQKINTITTKGLSAAQIEANQALKDSAAAWHLTTGEYTSATQAAESNAAQAKIQTATYQQEGDAVSLLGEALNGLAGSQASVDQAQTALTGSMITALSTLKTNKAAIEGQTQAAVNNQQALQGVYSSAIQAAQAIGKQDQANGHAAQSAADMTKSLNGSKTALENELKAQGDLTPAVQTYIDKLFDVKDVSGYLNTHPTKPAVDTAAAQASAEALLLKLQMIADNANNIKVQIAGIDAGTSSYGQLQATEKGQRFATGGPVNGPGTGTSDSISARLSKGEIVENAAASAKYRSLLLAINAGQPPSPYLAGMPGSPAVTAPQQIASAGSGMPSELVILDVNGQLVGRMKVEAQQAIDTAARQYAHVGSDWQ